MSKIIKIVLFLTAVFAGMSVQAELWYQVEVIVFDYVDPDLDREFWFENPGLPQREDSIELIKELPDAVDQVIIEINQQTQDEGLEQIEEDKKLVPYLALPEQNYRLKDDFRRLQLSSNYRPLLHVAWQQPALDTAEVRHVHLEKLAGVEESQIQTELEPESLENHIVEDIYTPPEPVFDGIIRIRSSNYLYVDVDFAYFPEDFAALLNLQVQKAGSQFEQLVNYEADYVRLSESMRIRLNELNYFDHPLFGILIQVSRIESG